MRLIKALKRPFRGLCILGGLCIVGWLGWSVAWQVTLGMPGYIDFFLHRGEYERVVQAAKAMPLTPGTPTNTTLNGRTAMVENDHGHYIVVIQTLDWDHAGTYGYVYSDTPLIPVDDPNDISTAQETILPIDSELNEINRRINAHWWSVYDGKE